ncbi:glycosyltransferase 87 family protein [Streptomyces sp. NPDC007100]|uniref:glycosyltransferase 87 family protein n=1 Tax=Streptomyces sp. NPDC007100 TaxID=3155602 RepID=UPI0033E8866A
MNTKLQRNRSAARKAGYAILIGGAGLFGIVSVVLAGNADAVDLEVYRAGGETVLAGGDLYGAPVWYDFRFTYPPFAALVFTPLALLGTAAAKALVAVLNGVLLAFVVARSWRSLGVRGRRLVPAVIAVTGASFALESVHSNFIDGQINLLLVTLVLADLTGRADHRARGVGVGIAAGLKLTPLIFVAYLVAARRYRQAAVASACAAGTVLVSFLLVPAAAGDFWLGGRFADLSRIHTDPASRHNQSLRGLLMKTGVPEAPALVLWLLLGAAAGLGALALAVRAARRGEHLLAVSLCGLCGAMVSPWSWGHHWVWLVPFGVFLVWVAGRPRRRGRWLPAMVLVALTVPGLLALADPMDDDAKPVLAGGPLAFVLGNIYVLIFVVALVAAVLDLRAPRDARCAGGPRRRTGSGPVEQRETAPGAAG